MNTVNLTSRVTTTPILKKEQDGTKKVKFFISVYSESLKEHKNVAVIGKNDVAEKLEKIISIQNSLNTKKFSALVAVQGYLDFFEKALPDAGAPKELSYFVVCEKISIFESTL